MTQTLYPNPDLFSDWQSWASALIKSLDEQAQSIDIAIAEAFALRDGWTHFSVYLASNQLNLVDNVWTDVELDAITFDKRGEFDIACHHFHSDQAGLYLFGGSASIINLLNNHACELSIHVHPNNQSMAEGQVGGGPGELVLSGSTLVEIEADQQVGLAVRPMNTAGGAAVLGGVLETFFWGVKLHEEV